MKKFISLILSAMLALVLVFSLAGCGDEVTSADEIDVIMPDGAPALAFAKLMHDENDLGMDDYKGYDGVEYTVVPASDIGTYIAKKTADVAVVPVNAASKLCADGSTYKMAAVLTHGNLFVIGKGEARSLSELKGQVVEVVNLPNVPGLTFKAILADAGIEYAEGDTAVENKVVLHGIESAEIRAKIDADKYVLAPQPAVANMTKPAIGASVVVDLQAEWGEGGYPQAVLMVKNELLAETKFMTNLFTALNESATWVVNNGAAAHAAIVDDFLDGSQTTLAAPALSPAAITGCNIYVQSSADAKESVKTYLSKIKAVSNTGAGNVTDNFFA